MRIVARVVVVLGALLALLSATMHGVMARRAVLARIADAVPAETLEGLNAAWMLGTGAMVAFALIALVSVPGLGSRAGARRGVAIGGAFFLVYGVWAFLYRHQHPHLIGFIAIGVLLLAGAALAGPPRGPGTRP